METREEDAARRPWTRWWWMGTAYTDAELTRQLEDLATAGFGGVEVSPIYGVPGQEERWTPFLSDAWVARFAHTLREADRLDLHVDLILGTGWPFGGPWVSDADAAKRLSARTGDDGAVFLALSDTGQQVKRAHPGAEGNVLDHFSAEASARYFAHFDALFDGLRATLPPSAWGRLRCVFDDSYEVFGANATPAVLDAFRAARGYDPRERAADLLGVSADPDAIARVRADYRRTVEELFRDGFGGTWHRWARDRHGLRTRFQAHGAPGDLLDLYAAADIPETETFGTGWLGVSGVEPLPGTPPDVGGDAEVLTLRFASSAAHVAGRRLCASETATWLGEHGLVPLAHVKAEADTLFLHGINHVLYHGIAASPPDAPWPGWLFYAATHLGPTNPQWRDLPALNAYLTACQTVLQSGTPDEDVLLYFPAEDLWRRGGNEKEWHSGDPDMTPDDLLLFLNVHDPARWLDRPLPGFTAAARALLDHGYGLDLVSARLLADALTADDGTLAARASGTRWKALAIAGCDVMEPGTLERIAELAAFDVPVFFVGGPPDDVPGLIDLDARRARLRRAADTLRRLPNVVLTDDLPAALAARGIAAEPMRAHGLRYTRRRTDDGGMAYFVVNRSGKPFAGPLPLNGIPDARSARLLDPMTGDDAPAALSPRDGGGFTVPVALAPGESRLLTLSPVLADAPPVPVLVPSGEAYPLSGPWRVAFLDGGPTLPAARDTNDLTSWTDWPGDDTDARRAFSGTARYTTTFTAPPEGAYAPYLLDLGDVRHSARVRLNGRDLGTLVAPPYRLAVPADALAPANTLEIEVTNLMANRLAYLDRIDHSWRPFLFMDIRYQGFDASAWEPLASGLLGPIILLPLVRA